jgi:hypothetical protein
MGSKLTKAEKLVQEQMLALLEWATIRPKSWHSIGTLPETQQAAENRSWRPSPTARPYTSPYAVAIEAPAQGVAYLPATTIVRAVYFVSMCRPFVLPR